MHILYTNRVSRGVSVIEILVVLVLLGVFLAVGLPRFQGHNTDVQFEADIGAFIETVSRAQSYAVSANSRSCAHTTQERLSRIDISRVQNNTYRVVPICANDTFAPEAPTPTPNPLYITTHVPRASEVRFLNCDSLIPECVFASFYPDGSVDPERSVEFQRGTKTCVLTISSVGIIVNSCD